MGKMRTRLITTTCLSTTDSNQLRLHHRTAGLLAWRGVGLWELDCRWNFGDPCGGGFGDVEVFHPTLRSEGIVVAIQSSITSCNRSSFDS